MGKLKTVDWGRYGIVAALVVLIVFFSVAAPSFLTVGNVLNILRQVSIVGICAVGMTFVILTGGIDLSVGSIVGVSAVVGAFLMASGTPVWLAILVVLGVGALAGALNGFLISEVDIAPIIATLGVMTALRGIAYIITGGLPIYGLPESFSLLGQGYFLGIPVPVFFLVAAFALGWFLLSKTTFGRSVYGIGGNAEATRLAGISIRKVTYKIYVFAGVLYAIAGLILLSRANSGQPKAGDGYEMDVITACVLGGISVAGGQGRISGVIYGVLIMGVLTNGMIMMNVNEYWQWVVKGVVLLGAVAIDRMSRKRAKVLAAIQKVG
ncbi:ABC transporter permease [Actinomycetaceae bacterium MB13-C1-2]|nr:ABC transporter permease [Actinomycetaceae bacterium MB13-C1-2]